MDEGLSAAVRKTFVELYKKGLIYRDKRLVNWDPKLLTAISDLEVEQREVKGHFWHLRYPIEGTDKSIVVATTRPETMLGDTAVAVHPDDERYKDLWASTSSCRSWAAKSPSSPTPIAILRKAPAPSKSPGARLQRFEVGKRHNLPVINIFGPHAKLNDNVPEPIAGSTGSWRASKWWPTSSRGRLGEGRITRCKYPTATAATCHRALSHDQWYLDAATLSKPCVEAVEAGRTQFVPKHWEKTYFEWMRNIQPWCISRQIWWATKSPPGRPDGTCFVEETFQQAAKVAGAHYGAAKVAEAGQAVMSTPEEKVRLSGSKTDVLDTWFSSALWPFSTLGWPDKTPELSRYYRRAF